MQPQFDTSGLEAALNSVAQAILEGSSAGQWQDYTPAWTNFTVGIGTLNYAQWRYVGAEGVEVRLKFTLGSTSSMSTNPNFTLPVEAHADYTASRVSSFAGYCQVRDVSVGNSTPAVATWESATNCCLRYLNATPLQTAISSTAPFTWATSDVIEAHFFYKPVIV